MPVVPLSHLVDTRKEGMLRGGCMRELQGREGVSAHGAKVSAQTSSSSAFFQEGERQTEVEPDRGMLQRDGWKEMPRVNS